MSTENNDENEFRGIWTVTTAGLIPGTRKGFRSRTWGYFDTEEEAVAGMRARCDDECGFYTHAIVECFPPGIYTISMKEMWFAWNGTTWAECDKPKSEEHTVNYGMG